MYSIFRRKIVLIKKKKNKKGNRKIDIDGIKYHA